MTLTGPLPGVSLEIDWKNLASPIQVSAAETTAYNGWPHAAARYDSTRDRVALMWTSGNNHFEGSTLENYDKRPRVATKPNATSEDMTATDNTFGAAVTAYSEQDVSCMSQAMAVMPNGDYLLVCGRTAYPNAWDGTDTAKILKSTDGGANWTSWNAVDQDDNQIPSSYPSILYRVPSTGRLINWNSTNMADFSTDYSCTLRPMWSDDDGVSWTRGDVLNVGNVPNSASTKTFPWEGAMYECEDGTLTALFRLGLNSSTRRFLAYSNSRDGGQTWTPLRNSTIRSFDGPSELVKIGDVLLSISSWRQPDHPGLYAAITTEALAQNGIWGQQRFMISGVASANFGYPGVAVAGSRIWCYWFQGTDESTHIYEVRGTIS